MTIAPECGAIVALVTDRPDASTNEPPSVSEAEAAPGFATTIPF